MAEESPAKPKRRLRPAATETVRERTERTQNNAAQPSRASQARKIFKPLNPIGRVLKRIGQLPPVRVLGFVLAPPYLRNAWGELRQVTWPNFRESIRLTSAVLVFAVIFGLLIAATDYGLDKLFKKVILKQ